MPTDLQRVQSVFQAVASLPPAERPAVLERECGDDAELRRRVEALLEAHDDSGELPAAELEPTGDDSPSPPPGFVPTVEPGQLFAGRYKLRAKLGEGGMGLVFVADQTEPVQRRVALKIIRAGLDTHRLLARFEQERQALALMDHPNIAKVFDAGMDQAQRPYFAMELVKGLPLTKYCDDAKLSPRQRLALFIPVCQAVQHAHQKGIIHRDLKPSNILVGLYDGRPMPKVIDFGVAKATGPRLTEQSVYTEVGSIIGTLEYMSPEQAEVNNLDIDTRSDIYALGVILYELLTGAVPFSRKELEKAGLAEMLRVIKEMEPAKPSTKLSHSGTLPSIAAQRHMEPRKLTALVRGELDWIVMKALEKDRGRRYETANGFAMDVQRYLADEPVLACPPSAGYRLRKFARRNKGGLAVAALVLFFLVLLGSSVGWAVRDRSAREAEAARQQGERQAKVAGEVESNFGEVGRLEKEQKWPEALEAARRAEAAVAGGEADPATAERVHQRLRDLEFIDRLERIRMEKATLVEGRFNLAGTDRDYARAFREYGVDVDEFPVETSIDRLKARPALAVVLAAVLDDWVFVRRRVSGVDIARWERLVAVARGIDPEPLRDRVRASLGQPVANVRDDLRRLAESIDVRAQHPATLILLGRTLLRVQHPDSALRILRDAQYAHPGDFWLNLDLGNELYEQKDHEGAVRFFTAAVASHPSSAAAHSNLGNALIDQKKFDEAVAVCRKAIELDPKFAYAYNNLGNALHDKGRVDEAIAEHRQAIALDPKDASAHNNLGIDMRDKGRVDEAIAEYQKAIKLDPKYANPHTCLGNALQDKGRVDEAIAEHRQAIALDPKFASAHLNLGNLLRQKGRVDEAIAEYRKVIALDPKFAGAHFNVGNLLRQKGLVDEAIAEHGKAIELDPKNASAHTSLGNALHDKRRVNEAIAEHRKAIALDPKLAMAHSNLGVALLEDKGRVDEAIAEHRKAIALDPKDAINHNNLGVALLNKGRLVEAIAECKKAIALDPKYAPAHYNLGLALRYQGKLPEAIDAFSKAIALDPKFAAAYSNLGSALRVQMKLPEAIAAFSKAIALDPKDAGAYSNLGSVLRAQMKLPEAIAAFSKAIALDPKDAAGYINLGNALRAQKKLPETIAAFSKAIELDPKFVPAYTYLGNLLRDQEKLPEAIAAFSKAIELDPKLFPILLTRGEALCRTGRFREALADFDKATELAPNDLQAWYHAAAVSLYAGNVARYRRACHAMLDQFEKGAAENAMIAEQTAKTCALAPDAVPDFARVERLAQRAVTGTEKHGWYRNFILAKALTDYRGGHPEQAVEWLKRSTPPGGNVWDATAFAVLAMAHHRLGHAEQARAALVSAHALLAEKPDAQVFDWLHCEILYREAEGLMGRLTPQELAAEAAALKQRQFAAARGAVRLKPDSGDALNTLAWFLATCSDAKLRDPQQAVTLAKKAVELDPKQGGWWKTLGVADYRAGHAKAAIAAFQKSMELRQGGDGYDWFFLAMAHWQLGEKDKAREFYDRAVQWMDKNEELCRFRAEASQLLELKEKK